MDIKIKEEYLKQAVKLHRENPVVDAHLDLAGEILLRNRAGERDVVKKYYLPHFKRAGLKLVVSSVYVETGNLDKGWENALSQIKALKEDVKALDEVILVEKGSYYYTYDGSEKQPSVIIKDGSVVIPASEYTAGYSDNKNVGDATVPLTNNEGGN